MPAIATHCAAGTEEDGGPLAIALPWCDALRSLRIASIGGWGKPSIFPQIHPTQANGKPDADQSMLETRIEENTGIQEDVQGLHGMANAGLRDPQSPGFFESGTGGNPCEDTPTSEVGDINVTYL